MEFLTGFFGSRRAIGLARVAYFRNFIAVFVTLALTWLSAVAQAYVLEGPSWPAGSTVTFQLELGTAARTLLDGNTSWDVAVAPTFDVWDQSVQRVQFVSVNNPSAPVSSGDGVNTISFSNTVFGQSFGSNTLAVTYYRYSRSTMSEADILFNVNQNFDSYRGPLQFGSNGYAIGDIRRILIHELGHALGLAHPDQNGQHVDAIMNSVISDRETTSADDISGAQSLYGAPEPTPTPSPTPSPIPSPTPTPTPTATSTPSSSPSPTPSLRLRPTPTPTPHPSPSPTPSAVPTPPPPPTPSPTSSPMPTSTPTATPTPSSSPTPTPSSRQRPASTPTPTPTPKLSPAPTPTATPTPTPTTTPSPTPADGIWIALRTDGKPGTGTNLDPYNGSTATKFDGLLRSTPAYTRIHLGPGTFLTTGSASYNEVQGYWIKPGWKINGAGKELTTVKATLYPAAAGTNGHVVFEGDRNVDGDGTEITDLTVDCNWQNLGAATNTRTTAIYLFGNNCRVSRVKAINAYGNRASLAECFCIMISPVHSTTATGAVVEDCDVSNFQGDYGYAICFPAYGGNTGKISASVRNNRVTGWIGTAAYSPPAFNSVFEGNYASGCQCSLYFDTNTIENVQITNNRFMDCHALGIFFMPTLGTPGMKNVTIEGNTIEIADYQNGPNIALAIGPASAGHATNITVRGNTILKKTTGTGYTDQAAVTISNCDGLLIENNVVDASLGSSLFVGTPYPNTNVTVHGNTTPLGGIPTGLEDR